ncbi:MAG: energy transducer TonB, partial [Bacteroidota bacterium]|nr:energy transducer TonB [Bacteroidota bacterium]
TDQQIDEIYLLAAYSKNAGQDFIPVHIFPIRYNTPRSVEYLATLTKNDEKLKSFAAKLEAAYDHFEITRQLPVIMVDSRGEYQYDGLAKKVVEVKVPKKREPVVHRFRTIPDVADVVLVWPKFQGGGDNFLKYLDQMGQALGAKLPQGVKKANVQVEFIVDVDGVPTNFKVLQGVNEDFDDEMITVLENMPTWEPAMLDGNKAVAKKIKQSFVIEK